MKKKCLFIMTMVKTGQKVYPILPELLKEFDVHVLLHYRTKRSETDYGEARLVLHSYNIKDVAEKDIASIDYSIMIIDNNLEKAGIEYTKFLKIAQQKQIALIACPHGNRDFHMYGIQLGKLYSHSFVFGNKDYEKLIRMGCDPKKLIPAGMPSNDLLKNFRRGEKHALLITGHLAKHANHITRDSPRMRTMRLNEFLETGIVELSKYYGCKIIVKTKDEPEKYFKNSVLQYGVEFVSGVNASPEQSNQIIADSKFVIGIPSTMAFSSIQLGIPTVVLKGSGKFPFGQVGNFYDFPGLINNINKSEIIGEVKHQTKNRIKFDDFIKETLEGGLDFNSINKYITAIRALAK